MGDSVFLDFNSADSTLSKTAETSGRIYAYENSIDVLEMLNFHKLIEINHEEDQDFVQRVNEKIAEIWNEDLS